MTEKEFGKIESLREEITELEGQLLKKEYKHEDIAYGLHFKFNDGENTIKRHDLKLEWIPEMEFNALIKVMRGRMQDRLYTLKKQFEEL